jgi:hypothetical protein
MRQNGVKKAHYTLIYCILAVIYNIYPSKIVLLLTVTSYSTLQAFMMVQGDKEAGVFECPLVPLIPCVAIFINIMVCMSGSNMR